VKNGLLKKKFKSNLFNMPTTLLLLTVNTPALVIEVILTGIVLGLQLFHFIRTGHKINAFSGLLPSGALDDKNTVVYMDEGGSEARLIQLEQGKYKAGFINLVDLINQYLEKNRHAADFGIIRSIVDSNIAVYEEDIISVVSLPLYIGLMGTFAGVALGLIAIAISGTISEQSIDTFIKGVIIAMTASFVGLLLTVVNNAGRYKQAKSLNERRKNDFFNFIRIHLLPYLGNDLTNVVNTFKNNINKFNTNFGRNLSLFDEKLSENVKMLGLSVSSLTEKIDPLVENTRSNREILSQLRSAEFRQLTATNMQLTEIVGNSASKLVEFAGQQVQLSNSITKMAEAIAGIDSVMNRIRRFEESLNSLGDRIGTADYMGSDVLKKIELKLDYLDKQFELLKQHSQNTSGQIEHHFIQEQRKIEDLSVRTISDLQGAMNFNIGQNPLKKLDRLDSIAATLNEILTKINPPETLPVGRKEQSGKECSGATSVNWRNPDADANGDEDGPLKDQERLRRSFWKKLFSSTKNKRGRKD
jgi:hypothetical protein